MKTTNIGEKLMKIFTTTIVSLVFSTLLATSAFAVCSSSQIKVTNNSSYNIYFSKFDAEEGIANVAPTTADCGTCGGTTISANGFYTFFLSNDTNEDNKNYVKMEFYTSDNEYLGEVEVGNDDDGDFLSYTSFENWINITTSSGSAIQCNRIWGNGDSYEIPYYSLITVTISDK